MKLRILHTEASTGWGGQEIRILDESAGMQARGHTLRIAAPAEAPIVDAARKRGLGADAIPINRRTLAGLRGLIAVIDAFKPDVIVTHSSTDSWLAALATWLFRRRVTVVRTRHLSTPIAAGILNRWLYGWVPRRVVTTGEAVRTMLIERLALNPAHVVSVPTGTDLARFFPGDRAEARRALGLSDGSLVGIVATLRSWKGHRFLLRGLARRAARGAGRARSAGAGTVRRPAERRGAVDARLRRHGAAIHRKRRRAAGTDAGHGLRHPGGDDAGGRHSRARARRRPRAAGARGEPASACRSHRPPARRQSVGKPPRRRRPRTHRRQALQHGDAGRHGRCAAAGCER